MTTIPENTISVYITSKDSGQKGDDIIIENNIRLSVQIWLIIKKINGKIYLKKRNLN